MNTKVWYLHTSRAFAVLECECTYGSYYVIIMFVYDCNNKTKEKWLPLSHEDNTNK